MAVTATAGVAVAAVVVAEEMANAKQTVEAEATTQQSTIKKQQMAVKTTSEVVWRPSAEDGNAATVAVAANATAEGSGAVGRWGGGAAEETAATVVAECSGRRPTLSMTITAPAKAGAIPARTMMAEAAVVARRITTPPSPPGGGLRSYRIAPALAVECSMSYTAAASALASGVGRRASGVGRQASGVGRRASGVGGGGGCGGAHPSDDRKDDDESGGRGGTGTAAT